MNANAQPPATTTNTAQRPNTQSAAPAPFKLKFTQGVVEAPPAIIVYGGPGIGKTTLAASAPDPVFIDLENGTRQIDVARTGEVETWSDLLATVRALITEDHPFKTVALDTLDRAEWLCWQHVCRVGRKSGIEDFGYSKGYTAAYEQFRILARELETLRTRRNVGIFVIAHAKIGKNPQLHAEAEDHEQWDLKVHKLVSGLFYESFDAVLFARLQTYTQRNAAGRVRGGGDARKLECQESPAWRAKNRFGLPRQMDLSWDALSDAMSRGQNVIADAIRAEIDVALERLAALDEGAASKARDAALATPHSRRHLSPLLNRIHAGIAARETASREPTPTDDAGTSSDNG